MIRNSKLFGNREIMGTMKILQRLHGTAPPDGERFDSVVFIKALVMYFCFATPLCLILCSIAVTDDFALPHRFDALCGMFQTITMTVYSLSCIYLGNAFQDLFDRIDSKKFGRPQKLIQEYYKWNKLTLLTFIIIYITLAAHTFYITYCDRKYIDAAMKIFRVESLSIIIFVLTWLFFFALLTFPPSGAYAIMGISLPKMIVIRIQDLESRFVQIHDVGADDFPRKFGYLIGYHLEILGCIRDINNTLGYCCIIQYTFITLTIASVEFAFIKTGNYMYAGSLLSWLFLEALLCFSGQHLEDKQTELYESVCDLPWYDMEPYMQLNFKIFLGYLQMPVHLKAQPIVYINNEFLLNLLRGTYSIFTLFLDFSE